MMRRTIACNILLFLLLALALPGLCQDFPLIHYTKKDGLPGNTVYQVYRDRTGFLWFATDKGVTRYNGIKFETFTTVDGLTDNDVINMFEDNYGRLWLNCFKGNLCYYKDGKIYSPANSDFLKFPFSTAHVFSVSLEKDSSFTALFSDRHLLVNIKDTTWKAYDLKKIWDGLTADLPGFASKQSPSTYEVLFEHGRTLMDTNYNILPTGPDDVVRRFFWRMGQDMTYLVSNNAVYKDKKPIYRFKEPHGVGDKVISLYISRTDTFLGTEKGLLINNGAPLLKDSRISDVSQDINGNYWVATLNNGVYHFNRRYGDNKTYNNSYTGQAQFVFADKGTLFVMTSDQKLFRSNKDKTQCIFDQSEYKGKFKDFVIEPGCVVDDKGNYHFLSDESHFILRDLLADKPKIKRNDIVKSPADHIHRVYSVKAICSTPEYIYILQSGYFIIRIDRSKLGSGDTSMLEGKISAGYGQRIYAMAQSRDNSIWFSTGKAMYKLVDNKPVLQEAFKGLSLYRFHILGDCIVGWGNDNKLVICNNINSNRMTVDTVPSQDCIWDRAYPIGGNLLLISTNNQYRILTLQSDVNGNAYELSTVENPFIPVDAEYVFADRDTCYFFKNGSITAIPEQRILQKAASPRLFFTGVSTPHNSYPVGAGQLSIPYSESGNIRVSFAALAFGAADMTYEYTLSGSRQDNWQTTKSQEINLLLPGSGSYTVTVRAKNASNVYSRPVSLLLTIEQPFWTSWWFILCIAMVCAGLLWWTVRIFIQYSLKKKEQTHASEIKFMKLEYNALNALMNPHFIFNSLNSIQGLVNGDNRLAANQYLVTFADLIRQNMHNASKELISLEKEMELIRNYLKLEKLRFGDWLHYKIDIEDQIDTAGVFIPPLLIQPLVENAIRHGLVPRQSADSLLVINIREDEHDTLHIEIRDNGDGLSRSQPSLYESTGLENIRKRTAQLKLIHNIEASFDISEIKDASGAVRGTLARISIRLAGAAQPHRS